MQSHPADVLALAVPGAEYLETLQSEVATEPQLVLDTLLRVRFEGVVCAVDLEAEARPRPDIGRRLFEYGSRASIVKDLPVISVVLWLEPNGAIPSSPYELHAGSRLLATWHFIGIPVFEVPAETLFARELVGLLPLVPFTREGHDLQVVERAAEAVKERASPAEVSELESLLAVFGTRTFGADEMRALMRRIFMSTEIIETSALYQEWIQKGRAEGRAEGRVEGRAEGETAGRAAGVREAALVLLRARFGEVAPDIEQALGQTDIAGLEALLPYLAAETLPEIRARLGLSEA